MTIGELKSKMDFYMDAIYQKGYDLGVESILEELEQLSDRYHNEGLHEESAVLATVARKLRGM